MNSLSLLSIAVFAVLFFLGAFFVFKVIRCLFIIENEQSQLIRKEQQHTGGQIDKHNDLVKTQLSNPDIMISDIIQYESQKSSERRLTLPNSNQHFTINFMQCGDVQQKVCAKSRRKQYTITTIEHPVIDNFNQSQMIEAQIFYLDDKLERTCFN